MYLCLGSINSVENILTLFSATNPSLSSVPIQACICRFANQFFNLLDEIARNLFPPDIVIDGGQSATLVSHSWFKRSMNDSPAGPSALIHSLEERQAGLAASGIIPVKYSPYSIKYESQRACGKQPLLGVPNITMPRIIGLAS